RLFRAAERAESALGRRKAAELRQKARTAQQKRDWATAERLWRESLAEDPGERMSTIGLAQVLVYNGKLDEARSLARIIVDNWPEDENGPTVFARLAEEYGDFQEAAAQWRQVLAVRPGRSQALIRLGRLLIAEKDFAEAAKCAEQMLLYAPDNPNAVSLLAEIDEARGESESAIRRRREIAEKFPHQPQLWRDYGLALAQAGQFEDCAALVARLRQSDPLNAILVEGRMLAAREPHGTHLAFWRDAHGRFPQDVEFVRSYLHAALRDGALDDARAALDALLAAGLARASDVNFVIGLVNVLEARGRDSEVRAVARDFLKRFRGSADYRRVSLKLSRIIFRRFSHPERLALSKNTLRMAERTPTDATVRGLFAFAASALERAKCERRLLDTDVSEAQCRAFVEEAKARLKAGAPWSFIRVNDGEANALPYEPRLEAHREADAAEREHVWWGRTLPAEERRSLDARVLSAMRAADCLGAPTLARVLREVRLDRPDDFSRGRTRRGLRAALKAIDEGGALDGAGARMLTSALLQFDLERWGLYEELFRGADGMILVSCHARLAAAMSARFGVAVERSILTPPRHASLSAFGMEMGPKILPQVLDSVIAELDGDLGGRMVVVGAGYAGKCVVEAARQRGAVALDLGSILDYWVGSATRSYQTAGPPSPEPLGMK
ncbi:MAG TPA: tetratricopeptide repeat protein, partial [Rhizomicrobium sp.]|nr:tetratricopeptide repeat protein [Rhizomicrobium sp.]